ncbi:MAG: EthD domain-containing protein [Chloroflexota bacterium]
MIHQHIYASPKPGMTEAEFQRYWLEEHAVRYASRIPQIRKYKLDMRLDWAGETGSPIWSGVAEIWLANEAEQLASLQTPEFLQGARLDEPKWAAFWNTLVLDCDSQVISDQMGETAPAGGVKLMVLHKRAQGLGVAAYREAHANGHAPRAAKVSGVLRHELCFTRDSWYAVGEPRFDSVAHYWFANQAAADAVARDAGSKGLLIPSDHHSIFEPRYVFHMLTREHWIIGPAARAYAA